MPAPLSTDQKKEMIVNMTALGSTLEECATVVGVVKRTIHHWRREDPDFKKNMDAARLKMHSKLKLTAYKLATGSPDRPGGKQKAPDRAMLIFMLKTQCGWSERAAGGSPSPDTHEDWLARLPQE